MRGRLVVVSPVVGSDRLGNAYVPEEGQQYEVGVKFQPAGYNSFITVSAFNLARQNVQTIDPIKLANSICRGKCLISLAHSFSRHRISS